MHSKSFIASGLFFILFFAACDTGRVYEESLKIPEAEWNRNETAKFEFAIEDSLAEYAFFLNFRHAGDYPYRNIYLFSKTKSPSGKLAVDTAQMILANSQGRWLGKGIGDIYDYQFKFKQGPLFPEKGTYQVILEQAMREKTLTNVTDIGIGIKKTTP
jgi:gliding motility-associated lipoprotein GldH